MNDKNNEDFDIQIADKNNVTYKNTTFIDLRKYLTIDINNEPWDLIEIKKTNNLLAVNYFQESLTLFDENFNVLKTIKEINNLHFKSLSATTNNEDRIYVSDCGFNRIISTNLDFELIATIGNEGSSSNQFNGPSGICYHEDHLFVCDYYNERIQKLSSKTLEFVSSYQLQLNPYHIRIINSTVAVRTDDESYIYFYNLSDFTVKEKYYDRSGYICVSNSCFYQFDCSVMKLYCYDENGKDKTIIKIEGLDDVDVDDWTCLTQFNERLVICPGSSLKMIVL